MGVKGKVLIEIYAQKFVCPFTLDCIFVTNSAQFEYFGRVIRFPVSKPPYNYVIVPLKMH